MCNSFIAGGGAAAWVTTSALRILARLSSHLMRHARGTARSPDRSASICPGRRPTASRLMPLLAAAAVLASCGGGGGSGDATPTGGATSEDYVPMAVGDRWVYRDETGQIQRETVAGTRQVSGQTAFVLQSIDLSDGSSSESAYLKTALGLTELPDANDAVSMQIGPIVVFDLPLQVGQRRIQVDKSLAKGYDLDSDGLADPMAVRSESLVVGLEATTVAAGTFNRCAHVQTVLTITSTSSLSGASLQVTSTVDEWYAPSVGVVRRTTTTEYQGQRLTQSRELVAYTVGGRRSELSAPTLSQASPGAGQVAREIYRLQLTFDEAIDLDSFSNGGLQLTAANGNVLTTSLSQDGTGTQVFAYISGGLPEGATTVRLNGTVSDMVGNALAPQSWTISVDRSAPAVISSTPASGAVDVPLNATVRLQFNEALDPATVNAANVVLRDGNSRSVPVTISMPDSRTVLIAPQSTLRMAQTYLVELAPAVTDTLGNPVFNTAIATHFQTVQGQFASPVMPAGASGRGLASGDIDGDGRTDLLTIVDGDTSVSAFSVFRQNASGGFDAPTRISTPPVLSCPTAGIASIADMDRDGRADIVSTRGDCGIEIAYQRAEGAFDRTVLLSAPDVTQFRLADLNGDGRLDVVAMAWAGDDVTVWIQRPDGSWGASTRIPLFHNGYGDLAVGDLNGDGRPDIAVTSGQGDIQRALGIVRQLPDGSFGEPRYQPLAGGFGTTPLTIADIDRDGRADLLVSAPGSTGVWVFRQLSDGTLAAPTTIAAFSDASTLRVADIDGDGRPDLLVLAGMTTSTIQLHRQAPDGSFAAPQTYRGGGVASSVWDLVITDLNGDGRLDLALTGPNVLLNLGTSADPAAAQPGMAKTAVGSEKAVRRVLRRTEVLETDAYESTPGRPKLTHPPRGA